MIAQIVVGNKQKEIDIFISEYQKTHTIRPSNVRALTPVKDELGIDEIRQLRRELVYDSTEPVLYIMYKFDSAAVEAQSALLKSLEEKKEWQHFILIVHSSDKIIPTILSRAKIVKLQSANTSVDVRPEIERLLSDLVSAKNVGFLNNKLLTSLKREAALQFVDEIIIYYRKRLPEERMSAAAIMKKALNIKSLLFTNNVHVQLAIDNLLIFCWKKVSMKSNA